MELNQWPLHYPFAEQVSQINGFVLKEKKAYIAGLGRDQLEHLASPMTKSESKYQRVQDKTGLEYYSPRGRYYWLGGGGGGGWRGGGVLSVSCVF